MEKDIVLDCGRIVPGNVKTSLLDKIVYYDESTLSGLGEGYIESALSVITELPLMVDTRYFLEDDYTKRHPIPYALLKYDDKYFLADRLKGGTEARLHGKKGMLGGHVDGSDITDCGSNVVKDIFEYSLLRELREEVGVIESMVNAIDFKGYIRITDKTAVEGVHLALVYVVDLNTNKITSEEKNILKGKWYSKQDIVDIYSTLEKWSELVIKNEIMGKV